MSSGRHGRKPIKVISEWKIFISSSEEVTGICRRTAGRL